jgi:demethylmenaquinone methyltransferase/2-methoxy-6-polyprenyl-1,4-benzoquinol methylase
MLDHFRWVAPIYDRVIPPPDPERLRQVLQLPISGALLDAGGGTGRVAQRLRPLVGALVIADESTGMLQQAQEKGLRGIASVSEQLPFGNGSFERVLVVDALHHFAQQQLAIQELARVLAPGGLLVIQEPDLHHPLVKLVALGEKMALMRSHFDYPEQIAQMMTSVGLNATIARQERATAWVVGEKRVESG